MKHNILIIGSGGREHALAWKIAQSPRLGNLYVAPGNAGTGELGENVPIAVDNLEGLAAFARAHDVYTTIVGPDDPLALGIVDHFQSKGLRIWGPTCAAARVESSKSFAKELMREARIPTAEFETFTDVAKARAYVDAHGAPIVIKASGLALGKGVSVCESVAEAYEALDAAMVKKIFGEAGAEVVIEECLRGREISIHAFSDGNTAHMFPTAQDHKQAYDGDRGPNTGGMGTIAPVPWVDTDLVDLAKCDVVLPALGGLSKQGTPFVGCLYPGLMLTDAGPRVLEFNARLGDPETQSYMRLLETDLLPIIDASIDGTLDTCDIVWSSQYACTIVLASGGYPGAYQKGVPIEGIEAAQKVPGVVVFYAGVARADDVLVTAGGRVLGVSAVGSTLDEALAHAYSAVELISFEGMQFRRDIGRRPDVPK